MASTNGEKTISFIRVTIKAEDVRKLIVEAARNEANSVYPNTTVAGGLVSLEPDNYGGFVVLVQKKDT